MRTSPTRCKRSASSRTPRNIRKISNGWRKPKEPAARALGLSEHTVQTHRELVDQAANDAAMVAAIVVGTVVSIVTAGAVAPAAGSAIASLSAGEAAAVAMTGAFWGGTAAFGVRKSILGDRMSQEAMEKEAANILVQTVLAGGWDPPVMHSRELLR